MLAVSPCSDEERRWEGGGGEKGGRVKRDRGGCTKERRRGGREREREREREKARTRKKCYMITWSLLARYPTLEGPFLIFFIWSLYFLSSSSSLAIFFSMDSPRLSTFAMQSVRLGGGAFFRPAPNSLSILAVCALKQVCVQLENKSRLTQWQHPQSCHAYVVWTEELARFELHTHIHVCRGCYICE